MDKDKLQKAYEAVEMLKALNLPVSKEQLTVVSNLEKEYLEKQIVPAVRKKVAELAQNMMNGFRIEIIYQHDNSLSISSSYNNVAKKARQSNNTKPRPSSDRSQKKKRFILRVTFPDGYEICNEKVSKTMAEVVVRIGAERVMALNIRNNGDNIIVEDYSKNDIKNRYCLNEVGRGYYLNTLSNSDLKIVQLEKISEALHLGLKVEKVWL